MTLDELIKRDKKLGKGGRGGARGGARGGRGRGGRNESVGRLRGRGSGIFKHREGGARGSSRGRGDRRPMVSDST